MLENKTILITGGAGSLGKTLVGNLLSSDLKVRKVIVYSRDELKHQHMRWEYPGLEEKIDYIIGDIRDQERVAQVCKGVDIIIHAAALKQISACEQNPEECYKTNVVGTQNVIKAAEMDHVEKLLFISTDKAVNPTSIYGNSKQACERLITRADSPQLTCATVRLGNLLGSAGSVIPYFITIKNTGELPVTDPEMTRFGGTLDQGVEACFYAIEKMRGGEIFIPRWKSFRVGDLADAIAPACLKKVIGARKHEKMHEQFFAGTELKRLHHNKEFFLITKEELTNNEGLDHYGSIKAMVKDALSSEENVFWTLEELKSFSDSKAKERQGVNRWK